MSHDSSHHSNKSLAPIHYLAPGFVHHEYQFTISLPYPQEKVWEWLNTPETFTKGQPFPYKVEFTGPSPDQKGDFSEGVMNVHHGPFLNFAGILTEVRPPAYRDLQYYYGSFAISQRWIRPNRLQFWLTKEGESSTRVTGQVNSYVRPWISTFWTNAQKIFWSQFKGLARRGLRKIT